MMRPHVGRVVSVVPVVLAAGLVLVWPLPHVIALRNSLLVLLFVWLVYEGLKSHQPFSFGAGLRLIIVVLMALAGWLFVVANPSRFEESEVPDVMRRMIASLHQ